VIYIFYSKGSISYLLQFWMRKVDGIFVYIYKIKVYDFLVSIILEFIV
jgi:hypothetical protein